MCISSRFQYGQMVWVQGRISPFSLPFLRYIAYPDPPALFPFNTVTVIYGMTKKNCKVGRLVALTNVAGKWKNAVENASVRARSMRVCPRARVSQHVPKVTFFIAVCSSTPPGPSSLLSLAPTPSITTTASRGWNRKQGSWLIWRRKEWATNKRKHPGLPSHLNMLSFLY